ncbi:MarR family winged helix-turn-helix transcriptional regulator [Lentzea sp. BCCO 10_0061]|uniref:MarR family winged helix-turn-helix transcriptional regulator n=1 Tax=Lentzea sokolovensis TaxID=3095429 RepID=A0ABU4VAV8_9PSEU|nr:MarR family winged helix-turn-helix transcriptional regulator [Lentzea sp. BCCO 10_0061]MDX8148926.1 MarR family winged helix-turn-helix transcriptional regulator [Lentzea sp. BCCO 10_0061]
MPSTSGDQPSSGHVPSLPVPPMVADLGPITHALFRVARLNRLHARKLLKPSGLHPAQELVMMQLWGVGPQRQTDLVNLLGSDAATMTRTIRRLEDEGFITRRRDERDKRATIIEATAESQALRAGVEQVWSELEATVTRGLDQEQRDVLLALLETVESGQAHILVDAQIDGIAQI